MAVVYSTWGGQIVHENRGGTERDYVPDTLGSTIALVDEKQNVTDTWEYWPYGGVKSHTGSSATPFTFVGTLGYFKDLTSSLTYVRARFYQAMIGQWMTVDPVWPAQPQYQYVASRPTTRIDPSGLAWHVVLGCAIGGIASWVGSMATGDDLLTTGCKALVTCIIGIIIALLLASKWAGDNFIKGCLIGGGLNALTEDILRWLCSWTDPCSNRDDSNLTCRIIFGVVACVISGGGNTEGNEIVEGLVSGIAAALGIDCGLAANAFNFTDTLEMAEVSHR